MQEHKYIIPFVPRSTNEFLGRKNVQEYREYKTEWLGIIALYCRPRPTKTINKAVVTLRYFFSNRIRKDPNNYNGKEILDGLTTCGIIRDDDFDSIKLQLEKGGVDKLNARTEIVIQEVEEIG